LQQLALLQEQVEVIVVDGGSCDDSLQIAEPLVNRVVAAPTGRALQMNAGTALASGSILWFLHADTVLPDQGVALVREALAGRVQGWGRFDVALRPSSRLLALVEMMMNLRSRITGIATGDQGVFVSRSLFEQVGGFPEIPLMEDVALSRLLKFHAKPIALRQQLVTSSRRWQQRGTLRTILLMWWLRLCYFIGVSPATLASWYR